MDITVRFASTTEDREKAYELRRQVFEVEQNVPRPLDRDANDHAANHVVAFDPDGACVGTGRLVRLDARTGLVGRMAVAPSARRHGVGARVIDMLHDLARMRGLGECHCYVQIPAIPFFTHRGYQAISDVVLLEGVPHVLMRKPLIA